MTIFTSSKRTVLHLVLPHITCVCNSLSEEQKPCRLRCSLATAAETREPEAPQGSSRPAPTGVTRSGKCRVLDPPASRTKALNLFIHRQCREKKKQVWVFYYFSKPVTTAGGLWFCARATSCFVAFEGLYCVTALATQLWGRNER